MTKAKPSGGRGRRGDQATKKAPKQKRVHASINRVMAECDKVDAVLLAIMRPAGLPPLTVIEMETGYGERTWAVVSGDPQKPLTEKQAKEIVAAMRPPGPPAPIRIAADGAIMATTKENRAAR